MNFKKTLIGISAATVLLAGCNTQKTVFDEIEAMDKATGGQLVLDISTEGISEFAANVKTELGIVSPAEFTAKITGGVTVNPNSATADTAVPSMKITADLDAIYKDNKFYIGLKGVNDLINNLGMSAMFMDLSGIQAEYAYITMDDMAMSGVPNVFSSEIDPKLEEVYKDGFALVKEMFTAKDRKYLCTVDNMPAITISKDNVDDLAKDLTDFVNNKLDSFITSAKTKLSESTTESTKALAESIQTNYSKEDMLTAIKQIKSAIVDKNIKFTFKLQSVKGGYNGGISVESNMGNIKLGISFKNELPVVKAPEGAISLTEQISSMYPPIPEIPNPEMPNLDETGNGGFSESFILN